MASSMGASGAPAEDFRDKLDDILECPECREQPANLVEEFSSGDMVCGSCGLVLGERIVDTRSEWRTFANDDSNNDDPSRVGDAGNPLVSYSLCHCFGILTEHFESSSKMLLALCRPALAERVQTRFSSCVRSRRVLRRAQSL